MNNKLLTAIRNTQGRFFGLYTKQGEVINAQLQSETEKYFRIYDRNNKTSRKLAKSSVSGVRTRTQTIGAI